MEGGGRGSGVLLWVAWGVMDGGGGDVSVDGVVSFRGGVVGLCLRGMGVGVVAVVVVVGGRVTVVPMRCSWWVVVVVVVGYLV